MPDAMMVLLTYVLINLLAPGATLTQGNRLQLTLGGALVGFLGVPLAAQLGNPGDSHDLVPRLAATLLVLAVLLLPALAMLDGSQRPRLSVADGFLLGFLPAFGYDALQLLLHPADHFALLPPDGQGFAYPCALIALAWTAGYRLSLLQSYAQFWAFCALAWAAFDRLALWPLYDKYASAYHLLAWTALVLLFWMAWLERVWVQRSPGHHQLESVGALRVPSLAEALKHGPRGWLARERALALRSQLILERTEMLERGRTVMGEIPTAYRLDPVYADPVGWLLRALALALGLVLLLGSSSVLLVGLGALLVGVHTLRSTDLDLDEANSVLSNLGHQIALYGALFAAVAALCFSRLSSSLPLGLGLGLVAVALQDPLRRDWQLFLEPYQRRLSMLHRAYAVLLTVLFCLAGVALYGPWLALLRPPLAGLLPAGPYLHYAAALGMFCLLAVAALLAGWVGSRLEEAFDAAGRRSAKP